MNLKLLFNMQEILNKRIIAEHNLKGKPLLKYTLLSFLVEVAEMCNEEKSFKFWKRKPYSKDTNRILEEYIDGFHFLLSMGLQHRFQEQANYLINEPLYIDMPEDLHNQILDIFSIASNFSPIKISFEEYHELFYNYMNLGRLLGFEEEEIEKMYVQKNQVNHERQSNKY